MTKFLRRTSNRYSKLGKGRKKKQIWRKPTGRDNKMREKRKGYPSVVSIGYKKGKKEHTKIVNVNALKDLENIQKDEIVIFGKMGQKKKIEFAKLAKQKKIEISNLNVKKFLNKIEEKEKKKVEEKKKAEAKPKKEEKKGKESESKEEKKVEEKPKEVDKK
jgi:large subunit ribosomal protein L32e